MYRSKSLALFSLLLLGFLICLNISSCSRVKTKQTVQESESSAPDSSGEASVQNDSATLQQVAIVDPQQPEVIEAKPLPVRRYARENPFVPLIAERAKPKPKKDDSEKESVKDKVPVKTITINLISIVDGNKAIFTEDGFVRVLSVGGYIAEMEILRIQSDSVILNSEDNEIYIRTGEQIDVKISG